MGTELLSQMLVMMQDKRRRAQNASRKRETNSSKADQSSWAIMTAALACSAKPASQAHTDAWLVHLRRQTLLAGTSSRCGLQFCGARSRACTSL